MGNTKKFWTESWATSLLFYIPNFRSPVIQITSTSFGKYEIPWCTIMILIITCRWGSRQDMILHGINTSFQQRPMIFDEVENQNLKLSTTLYDKVFCTALLLQYLIHSPGFYSKIEGVHHQSFFRSSLIDFPKERVASAFSIGSFSCGRH